MAGREIAESKASTSLEAGGAHAALLNDSNTKPEAFGHSNENKVTGKNADQAKDMDVSAKADNQRENKDTSEKGRQVKENQGQATNKDQAKVEDKHPRRGKGKATDEDAAKAAAEAKKAAELKKAEEARKQAELKRITDETQDKIDLASTILKNKADGEEILLKRAMDLRGKALGEDNPLTMQSVIELEHLYKDHFNCQKIEPLLEREMAFYAKFDDPLKQKEAFTDLVRFYRQDAKESLRSALETKVAKDRDDNLERSATVLRRVIELNRPQGKINTADIRNLALVFEAQDKMDLAAKAYDISFYLDGPNAPTSAYKHFGQFLFHLGRYDQAERILNIALKKDDDYIYTHHARAGFGESFSNEERDLIKAQVAKCHELLEPKPPSPIIPAPQIAAPRK